MSVFANVIEHFIVDEEINHLKFCDFGDGKVEMT